jgi:hypothetical protein
VQRAIRRSRNDGGVALLEAVPTVWKAYLRLSIVLEAMGFFSIGLMFITGFDADEWVWWRVPAGIFLIMCGMMCLLLTSSMKKAYQRGGAYKQACVFSVIAFSFFISSWTFSLVSAFSPLWMGASETCTTWLGVDSRCIDIFDIVISVFYCGVLPSVVLPALTMSIAFSKQLRRLGLHGDSALVRVVGGGGSGGVVIGSNNTVTTTLLAHATPISASQSSTFPLAVDDENAMNNNIVVAPIAVAYACPVPVVSQHTAIPVAKAHGFVDEESMNNNC